MGALDGRVAIITGAGQGLGREHALLFAREGASVVVNDLGCDSRGEGANPTAAAETLSMIEALGGSAVLNGDDVTSWDGAARMVRQAVDTFGDLHVLVNNAGIVREATLAETTEADWDAVVNVHLKGHFCPTRHAMAYWRDRAQAGDEVRASIVHTASNVGLEVPMNAYGAYGAAKAGIATLSRTCAVEGAPFGIRSNAVAPGARTRLTQQLDITRAPDAPEQFDPWHPANVSPVVAYLASDLCTFTGETFLVRGGSIKRLAPWTTDEGVEKDERWTVDAIADAMSEFASLS